MSDNLIDLKESVKRYWHSCIIHDFTSYTIAVHPKRGNIVYKGKWDHKSRLPHGEGKQYKSIGKSDRDGYITIGDKEVLFGKVLHKGIWNQGLCEGYGFHWWSNGTMYKGNWKDNRTNGYGIFYNSDRCITQKGTWRDGEVYNGIGKKAYKNNIYFVGEIVNGLSTKNGKYYNKFDIPLNIV